MDVQCHLSHAKPWTQVETHRISAQIRHGPIVINSEETHVGLVYMWMHGLDFQYQFWHQTTYSISIRIVVQVNIDTWWVWSQDERIFLYLSCYLGQVPSWCHIDLAYFYPVMKVLGRYIDPNGLANESILKNLYRSGIKKCIFHITHIQVVLEKCDTSPTFEEINFVCKSGQCLVWWALLSRELTNSNFF